VLVARDDTLIPPAFRLERLRAYDPAEAIGPLTSPLTQAPDVMEEEVEDEVEQEADAIESDRQEQEGEVELGRSRRRRRRRRRRDAEPGLSDSVEEPVEGTTDLALNGGKGSTENGDGEEGSEADRRKRRRGHRGGRRRGRRESDLDPVFEEPRSPSDIIEIVPASENTQERAPIPMIGRVRAPGEIGDAQLEAAHESEPPGHDAAQAQRDIPAEVSSLTARRPYSVGMSAGSEAEAPPDKEPLSDSATEQSPEVELSVAITPEKPEHPVELVGEKPSAPRRGWWQRLIQP
jgi:ribonuclease E